MGNIKAKKQSKGWVSLSRRQKWAAILSLVLLGYFVLMIPFTLLVERRIILYLIQPVYGQQYNAYFGDALARALCLPLFLLGLALCIVLFVDTKLPARRILVGIIGLLLLRGTLSFSLALSRWARDLVYVREDAPPTFSTVEYTLSEASSSRKGDRLKKVHDVHVTSPEGVALRARISPEVYRQMYTMPFRYRVEIDYLPNTQQVISCRVSRDYSSLLNASEAEEPGK